ncbi:MAG: glycogen synthase [Polyangiales bacterium]
MEIVFVTSEITPYSRSGEIGDVCAALPKALRSVGHKVTVISPLWTQIDAAARGLARRLTGVEAELGGKRYACTLHDGRTTGGVELLFIGQSELFTSGPEAGSDSAVKAALVFAQAAGQALLARSPVPNVVHAHGWFAAATLVLCERAMPGTARVLSLHDARLQGKLRGLELGLPESLAGLTAGGDEASVLRAGIAAAQRVVAGSQTEAYALLGGEHEARELTAVLASQEGKLVGVLNGVDAARWNSLTDPLLPARFDHADLRGKARCKDALQLELELPVRPEVPLVACVGDLTGRAAALIEEVALAFLRNDAQLSVISSGEAQTLDGLRALQQKYRERLALASGADERVQHLAIGAADFLLLAERDLHHGDLYACGQRYGALPVAHKAFAIADGVVDCDAELTSGSGFTFAEADATGLLSALQRALSAFQKPKAFAELRRRTMRIDLSWERSARRYEHIYRTAK